MLSGQRRDGGPRRPAPHCPAIRPSGGSLGFAPLVSFIAVLSVNLGLINLFPIPILDGGHLLFYFAIEAAARPGRSPQQAQEYGFRAGLALLAALFVFVDMERPDTYRD